MLYRMVDEDTGEHVQTIRLEGVLTPRQSPMELIVNGESRRYHLVRFSSGTTIDLHNRPVMEIGIRPVENS